MIDIQKTIFSSKGSYIGIFQESSEIGSGVWIRSLIRPEWGTGRKKLSSKMLKILPYSNNIFTEFHVECEAHVLSFIGDMGHITAIIPNCYTLKLSMANSDLVLEHDNEDLFAAEFTEKKKSFSGYYPICNTKFEIELKNGSYVYNKKSKRVFIRGCRELSIKILRVDLDYSAYREMLTEAEIKNDFERFYASYGLENYHSRLASYILWSGSVMPLGYMKRLTNPISKLKMNMFFSWANCFIAIAQVDSDVELAKSNFLAIVDFQKENGFIYDAVNPVLKVVLGNI